MQPARFLALLSMSASALAVTCTDGAVVYCVRGSDPTWESDSPDPNYNQLPQGMTDTANAIVQKHGGYVVPISYPSIDASSANENDGKYQQSVQMGVNALHDAIVNYVAACPTQGKVFVLGYSQGAQVVSGVLGGCQSSFCSNQPIDAHRRIAGAAVFGDPGFVNGLGIDAPAGSATGDGSNGVTGNGNSAQYDFLQKNFSGRFLSYCQSGDAVCNPSGNTGGQDPGTIHGNECETYAPHASKFLVNLA